MATGINSQEPRTSLTLNHGFQPLAVEPALRRDRSVGHFERRDVRVDLTVQSLRYPGNHAQKARCSGNNHDLCAGFPAQCFYRGGVARISRMRKVRAAYAEDRASR